MTLKNTDAEPVTQHDTDSTPSTDPTEASSEVVTYGDAVVLRPYNEDEYGKEITITVGAHTASKSWKPIKQPLGAFIAKLCQHKEGEKDGPAFVLGDMAPGQRLKVAVKTLECIGLDIDTGTPSVVVDAALTKFGFTAVRYSTHSFGKTKTEFKKDKIKKFTKDANLDGYDIDDELIRKFLLEVEHWDSSIVETAVFAGEDHTEKGIVIYVEHRPMPKHRVVVPLLTPFEIAKEGDSQKEAMDKWAKVPEALANMLGLPFDRSCIDPSRLFYFPRHGKSKPFEISLWGGPLFDYHSLTLSNPLDDIAAEANKGGGKSVTPEGRKLGRWSITHAPGFQIVDVLEEYCHENIRGSASSNGKTILCPFDEDHSNPGDTDDTGCFAVNAGYSGHTELFTISCRHETCRNKTMLDMLGKMLKDGWFDKSVLTDDNFNAIIEETPEKPKSEVVKKIEKENKAKAEYQRLIDELTVDSDDAKVEKMADSVHSAALGLIKREKAVADIAEKLGKKPTFANALLKDAEKRAASKVDTGTSKDKKGKVIFSYRSDYNHDEAVAACLKALRARNTRDEMPTYCQIGEEVYRLERTDDGISIVKLAPKQLRAALNGLILFRKVGSKSEGGRKPVPQEVADDVYAEAHQTLPEAPEIVSVPTYLEDGSLLVTPGYHYIKERGLNVLYEPPKNLIVPEIPEEVTVEQVQEAVNWIRLELLSDFPFNDVDLDGRPDQRGPSEAAAFAMILTNFMRRMIKGRTPIFFVKKPQPRTGGSLLSELPIRLFEGGDIENAYVEYTASEEEMGKNLVSAVLVPGRSHMFFEDVKEFRNRKLHRAITKSQTGGRLLGASRLVERPNNYGWIANGNNPIVSDEMLARICWINLNAKTDDVTKRNFRHSAFNEFVERNRGLAISHVLTMIEFWLQEKQPMFTAHKLSGFEDWSAKVGGVLMACGVEGFLARKLPKHVDEQSVAEQNLVDEAFKKFAVTKHSFKTLFEWASVQELDALGTGKTDQQKVNLRSAMGRIENRTFRLGADQKLYSYTRDDSGDYCFVAVPEKAAPEEPAEE